VSTPVHLSPQTVLSPEGCRTDLQYRWFVDDKPMWDYDDFPTFPLNPQYLSAEQTLLVVINADCAREPVVASIEILVVE
jgi:hypothetical protein